MHVHCGYRIWSPSCMCTQNAPLLLSCGAVILWHLSHDDRPIMWQRTQTFDRLSNMWRVGVFSSNSSERNFEWKTRAISTAACIGGISMLTQLNSRCSWGIFHRCRSTSLCKLFLFNVMFALRLLLRSLSLSLWSFAYDLYLSTFIYIVCNITNHTPQIFHICIWCISSINISSHTRFAMNAIYSNASIACTWATTRANGTNEHALAPQHNPSSHIRPTHFEPVAGSACCVWWWWHGTYTDGFHTHTSTAEFSVATAWNHSQVHKHVHLRGMQMQAAADAAAAAAAAAVDEWIINFYCSNMRIEMCAVVLMPNFTRIPSYSAHARQTNERVEVHFLERLLLLLRRRCSPLMLDAMANKMYTQRRLSVNTVRHAYCIGRILCIMVASVPLRAHPPAMSQYVMCFFFSSSVSSQICVFYGLFPKWKVHSARSPLINTFTLLD